MVTRRTRYRPHAIRGPALSRLCIRGLLRACCRTAARDACGSASLCRRRQVMAAETVVSTGRGATQSGPVLCRGTAWHCCSSPHCRVGPARWPRSLCARSKGQAALCVRQRPMQQSVQGSRGCRGRVGAERRRDALAPAAGLTRRLPVCGQHTEATARGAAAQRHRSASLAEEKSASREAPQQCASRRPRSAALVKMLCPCEELQQPVESCPCDALDSPALCCLEGPEERARSRVGEHQGQVAADLRGMHAPVRGIDSSHCPQLGAARTPGVHNTRPERPALRSPSAAEPRTPTTAH